MTATITAGDVVLEADVGLPPAAGPHDGVVAFAHGSGSGRFSPRNRYVASVLVGAGFATVLADLLTAREEAADRRTGHLRFDIDLLAARTAAVVDWIGQEPRLRALPVGLFGASTGAAAALKAAVRPPGRVQALVSRGGRADLAGPADLAALGELGCPTLLIVGGRDEVVLELNRRAAQLLGPVAELVVIPDATHLFEEPGTLEEVARLAAAWFSRHLALKEGNGLADDGVEHSL